MPNFECKWESVNEGTRNVAVIKILNCCSFCFYFTPHCVSISKVFAFNALEGSFQSKSITSKIVIFLVLSLRCLHTINFSIN